MICSANFECFKETEKVGIEFSLNISENEEIFVSNFIAF